MRKFPVIAMAAMSIALFSGQLRADQKVAILALSRDSVSAKQVESGLRDQYANVHVVTLSVHETFAITQTTSPTAPQIAAQLLRQGYTQLLCVSQSPAVNLTNSSAAANPVMQDCLTVYSSGTYGAACFWPIRRHSPGARFI